MSDKILLGTSLFFICHLLRIVALPFITTQMSSNLMKHLKKKNNETEFGKNSGYLKI